MADLLDIVPEHGRHETVTVLGQEIEIRPLLVADIAALARRFPDLRKTLFRAESPVEFRTLALLEAMPAIVATATGHADDRRYEDAAARLPQPELTRLATAIMRLTYGEPESDDPLPSATVIAQAVAEAAQTTATSSPLPSSD